MSSFSFQSFQTTLEAHLPCAFAGRFCVAFSGGLDSTVLLHALAELRNAHPDWAVRAIHIDHQLQAASSDWASQCSTVAAKLEIELTIERVQIDRDDPQGLEAAARTARYAVFRRELRHGEALLTAHHADDQVETVLLALLRGAGVQGLAAMPASKPFARGWHVRPLLPFTRRELAAWARERGIVGIEDPSNQALRHDRNFLRHQVLPVLRTRWPAMAANAVRSTGHVSEALALLETLASADLQVCAVASALSLDALRALSGPRRRNLLRYWLRLRGLPLPSTRKLAGLEHDLLSAGPDRTPRVTWRGAELHWHRGLLYAQAAQASLGSVELPWRWQSALALPAALGTLSLTPTQSPGLAAARLPESLSVRFRSGGERIQLPGRSHRHALKKLLQENNVLPWWRERLPLIYAGSQLLAVGDLFLTDELAAQPGEVALRVLWEGAPAWQTVTAKE